MKIDLTRTHDVDGAYKATDFSQIRKKYQDPGTQYCFTVLDGKIVAGYQIKLACFRHLRDLQRQNTKEFPYHYDVSEVDNILKFAAVCPEIKTRKPVKLMGWQKFILAQLIGWRDTKGDKRFTRAIVSVARHNGKTYLMAIITIYSFLIESINEAGQDFLVSSINYKQTSKLMGYVKQMLRYLMDVQPFGQLILDYGINPKTLGSQSDQIVMSNTGSRLLAVTYKSGQYDSFHFKTAVGDEFADPEVGDSGKISKITSGQLDVDNKQFIQISTAYENPSVPFHNDEKRIINLMEADYKRQGDAYLVLNWCQDNEEEALDPSTWAKSNPLINMSEKKERLLMDLKTERDNDMLTGNILGFQNKSMNIWMQQSADSFLDLSDVEKAVIPSFDIRGRQVYVGFDYSMMSDNTAIAFVYPYQEHGHNKWHLEQHSFIPWKKAGSIEAKEKQDGINYREQARKGYCTITSHKQGLINDDQVYSWLLDYIEDNKLDVVFFGYDTYGVTNFIRQLDENTSLPLEAIRQRTSELKDPTKFLQRIFVEGNATRLDDPILEKALLNAEIYEDKLGIQVDKPKGTYKIDVVDAIIDALYQGMYHFEDYSIVNDKSKQVDRMTAEQVKAWFENKDSGLLDD